MHELQRLENKNVPVGPDIKTPLGNFPPNFSNFSGVFRNCTISWRSSLAPSQPITCLNGALGISAMFCLENYTYISILIMIGISNIGF